jgi:hypothetical protein
MSTISQFGVRNLVGSSQHAYFNLLIITADDWDFEEAMANLGCTVHAYDPSVTRPENVKSANIHFYPVGIGHSTHWAKSNILVWLRILS